MRYLRSNTATRITVGPFLDKTDGITPETGLTATNEKLTLMVDTAGVPTLVLDVNATGSGGSNDLVHVTNDDAGFYDLELAAANVNYVGRAILAITYATDHCPVFHEFEILEAAAYDALHVGGGAIYFTAATGTLTASSFTTNLTVAADALNGRRCNFLTGTLAGQQKSIYDTVASGGRLDFNAANAFTAAPSNGDIGVIW